MGIPQEQQEVAQFLRNLAGAEPVETHISAVFVGAEMVWKLKKAVRMPFVDFTTVEARKHFLERELALNQPAAPGIYHDVAAVVRDRNMGLSLTTVPGEQPPLDWVLRMAPVPKGDFLDVIAAEGRLTPTLLDSLGDCVVRYHAGTKPASGWDSPGALEKVAEGNMASALAAGLPPPAVRIWLRQTRLALEKRRSWLATRAAAGFVRRAHGDLHLGNLCLWQDEPVPFDALEFDEELATIDLGYDLAFLLMDLDQRVSRAAANRVLNRYVARTGDAALTHGLAPFLSLRAMIRAHVRAAAGHEAEGRRYLDAALDYLQPKSPVMLAIGGLQGTGKSTLARILAPELGGAPGALVLRSDEIRKRLFRVSPEQRLPATAYSAAINAAVGREMVRLVKETTAGDHAVIADATFLEPDLRAAIAASSKAADVAFFGFWLHAPLAVLEARLIERQNDASDATVAVLRRSAMHDPGPMTWHQVDASNAGQAAEIIRHIIARKATTPQLQGSE